MQYKKYRVTLPCGVRVELVEMHAPSSPVLWVELTHCALVNGVLSWKILTSRGDTITGSLRTQGHLGLYVDDWVKPSIPLLFHDRRERGLSMDFIFHVPQNIIARG